MQPCGFYSAVSHPEQNPAVLVSAARVSTSAGMLSGSCWKFAPRGMANPPGKKNETSTLHYGGLQLCSSSVWLHFQTKLLIETCQGISVEFEIRQFGTTLEVVQLISASKLTSCTCSLLPHCAQSPSESHSELSLELIGDTQGLSSVSSLDRVSPPEVCLSLELRSLRKGQSSGAAPRSRCFNQWKSEPFPADDWSIESKGSGSFNELKSVQKPFARCSATSLSTVLRSVEQSLGVSSENVCSLESNTWLSSVPMLLRSGASEMRSKTPLDCSRIQRT